MDKETTEQIVSEVIDAAIELKLIRAPALLKRKTKIMWGRGYRCFGGICWKNNSPRLQIGIDWAEGRVKKLREYARIRIDHEIGNFVSDSLDDVVKAMVCHELAHVIDYWNWHKGGRKDRRPVPHGSDWRFIYRQLRRHFGLVNESMKAA